LAKYGRLTKYEVKPETSETKPKLKKSYLLKRLWKYMSAYKGLLIICSVLVVGSTILGLYGPNYAGEAIDAIGTAPGEANFPLVFKYFGLMIAFYAASAILSYVLSRLTVRLSRNIIYKMRKDVFEHLSTLPVSFFDQNQSGEILSTLSYDIDTVNQSLTNDFLQICKSIVTVSGALYMMIRICPILVLVFVVTLPISIISSRFTIKKVRPLFRARSKKLGELNGYVEEITTGHKTIKSYGREEVMIERFDERNDTAIKAYTRAEFLGTIVGPAMGFMNNVSLALVSVFGAVLFIFGYGGITIGNISSFVLYSRRFAGPINELANIAGDLQSAFAAADRVFRLLDEPSEQKDPDDSIVLEDVKGDVELSNVNFGYVKERQILKDISFGAPEGKMIAIVGPTGSGKTTIINLLMRFYDVDSGTITIDGHSIYGVTRDSLRKAFTMVLQDTWLFTGTIYDNIAYGKPGATMEDVEKAAKAAHIDDFITHLPDGYNTEITDGGLNMSKGQKQLLTIARAMMLDSKVLILDEATSNVDTQTERMIQAAMRELMKGRTCFVIAHRLSTIEDADLILVIKDGEIVERGKHNELMEKAGFYYSLYYSQFDAEDA